MHRCRRWSNGFACWGRIWDCWFLESRASQLGVCKIWSVLRLWGSQNYICKYYIYKPKISWIQVTLKSLVESPRSHQGEVESKRRNSPPHLQIIKWFFYPVLWKYFTTILFFLKRVRVWEKTFTSAVDGKLHNLLIYSATNPNQKKL